MNKTKIAEYRAAAAACKAHAEADPNKSSSWLEVAAEWDKMADDLERNEHPETASGTF